LTKRLAENFEKCDEKLSIPRELFYEKYLEFAQSMNEEPMNAASLGKIVRAAFQPTTRRLGVRGHSKYHYCGLKIRSDSYLHKVPGLAVESTTTT
jgi:regulatory factor X 1/2/3